MKIKFLRAIAGTAASLLLFLSTVFFPSIYSIKVFNFLQGFSLGTGVGAIIASLVYYFQWKKEDKEAQAT